MKGKNIDGKINNKETWNSGNEEWENEKKNRHGNFERSEMSGVQNLGGIQLTRMQD